MADFSTNTVADLAKGAAVEGLDFLAPSLTATVAAGLIDGRAVAATTVTLTASTTGGKYRGALISEDGDGTYTATLGTDDLDSAALAAAEALTLAVPSGGVGIATCAVDATTGVTLLSMAVRGQLPGTTTDGVLAIT